MQHNIGLSYFLIYSIFIWFFFWLYNHSYILEKLRLSLNSKLPFLINYGIGCSFCFTFWSTVFLFFMINLHWVFIFICPVINLFIELIYNKLSS